MDAQPTRPSPPEHPPRGWLHHLRLPAVLLLTAALLAWFFWGVDLEALGRSLRGAHPGLLLLSLAFALGHFFLRAWRWRYLLLPLGEARYGHRLSSTVAGYAVNNLLPARGGEVARPWILARRSGLPFPGTLATVVLERVLDMLTVGFLFVFSAPLVLSAATPGVELRGPVLLVAGLSLALVAGWLGVRFLGGFFRGVAGRVLGMAPGGLGERIRSGAAHFLTGFQALGRGPLLLMVLASSLLLWLDVAVATLLAARAFDVPLGLAGALFVTGWLAVGMAAPTPAGVGGYHAAGRYALTSFFGVPDPTAVAVALVLHALSVVPVSLWGLGVLAREGLHLTGWEDRRASVASPPKGGTGHEEPAEQRDRLVD